MGNKFKHKIDVPQNWIIASQEKKTDLVYNKFLAQTNPKRVSHWQEMRLK